MRFVMTWLFWLAAPVLGLSPGDVGDVTTPVPGCQLCASIGDCSHAFRDGPGQYCGTWMDRSIHEIPCCCPLNSVCNVSPADFVCTCAYVGAMPPYHSESDLMTKVLFLWWILGILMIIMGCGACGYFIVKQIAYQRGENGTNAPPEMIVPVVSPTREALYGSTGQTPAVTTTHEAEESNAGQRDVVVGGSVLGVGGGILGGLTLASHIPPPDDLDVGGDGFDGGLGGLEKVEEVEAGEAESDEEEKVALLTVPNK